MKNVADFIQIEEEARKLGENIKKLNQEAVNYKNSAIELDKAREELVNLITVIQSVVDNTGKLIEEMRYIGTPEILSELSVIKDRITETQAHIKTGIESIETNINNSIMRLTKQLSFAAIGGFGVLAVLVLISYFL